jgi:subtilisin-like proprotein convertase family protein
MLAYFERAQQGVRGIVRDSNTGLPLPATVKVVGTTLTTLADPAIGDYHQILLPGTYTLEVTAPAHTKQWIEDVVVGPGAAVRRDVWLRPTAVSLQPIAHRVLDGANSALDPGETADFALTLKNLGNSGTVVSATLIPTTAHVTAPRATASYPSIFSNSQQESSAPYYSVALAPGAPVGHKAGFGVKWQTAQGSGVSGPYFVPVGARTCTTVASSDVPKAVNDRSIVTSTLAFPTDLEIEEVNVYTNVTHPYKGDLAIYVTSPSGTPVLLHSHSGGAGDNVTGWFDTNLVTFEQLSKLEGEHSLGSWSLKVEDAFPANTGSVAAWSLEVCGRPFETTTPELKFRAFTKTPESPVAQVEWWRYPTVTSYRVYRSTSPSSAASFVDVSAEDPNPTDTTFVDQSDEPVVYYLVTGIGPGGEGPMGHFGQ